MAIACRRGWVTVVVGFLAAMCSGCAGVSVRVTNTPPLLGRFVAAGEKITIDITVKNTAGCNLTGLDSSPFIALLVLPFVDVSQDLNQFCAGEIAPAVYAQALSARETAKAQFAFSSQNMIQLPDTTIPCIAIPDGSLPPYLQNAGALVCTLPVPVPYFDGASAQATIEVTAHRSGRFRSVVFAGADAVNPAQCIPDVESEGEAGGFACDQAGTNAPAVSHSGLLTLIALLSGVGLLALHRRRQGRALGAGR